MISPQVDYTIDRAFEKLNSEMIRYGITTEDFGFFKAESPALWGMIRDIEDTVRGDMILSEVQEQCDKYVEAHRRVFARRKAQKELSS